MCWVIGIKSFQNVNQLLFDGLISLQHRGQDAAGIATLDNENIFNIHKNNGLVRDVLRSRHMEFLKWNSGIGHVRYPTAGCSSSFEAQPFYVNSPFWITLAHNGNLINTEKLSKEILEHDKRHLNTSSDSEILINVLAHELYAINKLTLDKDDIFKAFKKLYTRVQWAFASVALIGGHGMLAFRDHNAIRPLIFGEKTNKNGKKEYIVASESVALDILWFEIIRDVLPWEVIYFPFDSDEYYSQICAEKTSYKPCIFEYVYLARPDSIIDNVSVYKTRLRMWTFLVDKIREEINIDDIDVVMPVPDSWRTVAIEIAEKLGKKYREWFIKNRYIWRTFIMPGQEIRKKSIRAKLNPIPLEFKNRNVLLVDDSIVRWNTSEKIIDLARKSGAKNIYFVSAAPPVKYPNIYWIDIPTRDELIANNMDFEGIAKSIWADKVIYQSVEDLLKSWLIGNENLDGFEASVFDKIYCEGNITEEFLNNIEEKRNELVKK